MKIVTFDFETRSEADIKKVGAWAYSEHPSTEVICACYQINTGPIQRWWPHGAGGDPRREGTTPDDVLPWDLDRALPEGYVVEAHNVSFEYSIWYNVCARKYGWPVPELGQWRDTMAAACYYAMPPSLDRLCAALRYEGKDPDGTRLITKYSKLYLPSAKRTIPDEDFKRFVDYCARDVLLEATVSDYLGELPDEELKVFQLDLEVNARGLYLDRVGIAAATAVVDRRSGELTKTFKEITGGIGPMQRDEALVWFRANGVQAENMQEEHLRELLEEGDIPQGPARTALEIRLAVAKASTRKLDAMARQVGKDGRARFQTRYHGTATGRNTGAGFHPLNLNRGFEKMDPEQLVRDIMFGDPVWLDCVYGDAMDAVAKASRYWITAAPGNVIRSADFVSIEAVILACLAGEGWKVEAFRDGVGIYEAMACKIYNLGPEAERLAREDKEAFKARWPHERQDGKTGELAFGYQGALNAWLNFDSSGRHTDQRIIEICKAWRAGHPAIVNLWGALERAATTAVTYPGRRTETHGIGFEIVDEWLTMILLDGKRLWYRDPQTKLVMPQWHKPALPTRIVVDEAGDEWEEANPCHTGDCRCEPRPQVTYMAQKFGHWRRVATYGGKLTENAVQALSRQRLKPARLRLKAAGYKEILSVYDEIVCENKKGFGSLEEFKQIMLEPAGAWDRDWPINVDAWEGHRYRK